MQTRAALISFSLALLCGCTGISAVKPDGSGIPAHLKSEQIAVVAFAGPPLKVMTAASGGATSIVTAQTPVEAMTAAIITVVVDAHTRPVGAPAAVPVASHLIASSLRDLFRENLLLNHDFHLNGGQRLHDVMQVAADRCAKSMAPPTRS